MKQKAILHENKKHIYYKDGTIKLKPEQAISSSEKQNEVNTFAPEKWKISKYHDCLYLLGTNAGTLCELQFYNKDDAREIAPAIAETQNMYSFIKKICKLLESTNEPLLWYPEIREAKEIINRINQ